MSPHDRKAMSEAKLRAIAVPVNDHLPMIEADHEVDLRSPEEVLRRLLALWAVVDKAFLGSKSKTSNYFATHNLQPWLSNVERDFLLNDHPSRRDGIHFSWQLETFYFLAWCAGLLACNEIPNEESSVKPILHLFPVGAEKPDRLRAAIHLRDKSEVLDRADILYRLHWAVRNAQVTGSDAPKGIDGGVVQEWHRAVNWMIRYDGEDNWDNVGTDT
ncbi:MAG: DUF4272 domain-containing protein [Hydrogenophaga sp.]|uniref:DUF4272 domain-containing protein n=1 Tax=Hydrogenophaga sp. TaxID=1904254 RepID=UPI0025C37C86|nr:DUF4272 domain-containing protein [Hydrogenophaga sp.]MBT9553669.1 DUF4272 domain-containing protein [Hydrogenophaga sp.]